MTERDLPTGIEVLVRAAARRHAAVRAAEGLLIGLSAALLTAAAGVFLGAAPLDDGPLAAAGLAGLCSAGIWWLARRRTRAQLVRTVDGATLADGALVTAFECAQRPARNPLESALIERAAQGLDPRAARRSIAPPAVGLLAAPLAVAALLSFLLEARPGEPVGGPGSPALRNLALALGGAGSPAPTDPELAVLLERALALAGRPERAAALERALEELEAGLEQRAGQASGQRATEFAEALILARAARAAAGGSASVPTGPVASPRPSGSGEQASGSAGGDSGGGGLAAGPAASTMAGSSDVGDVAGDPLGTEPATGATGEAGVVAGRTWDAQYDGVVSAWVLHAATVRSGERSSE